MTTPRGSQVPSTVGGVSAWVPRIVGSASVGPLSLGDRGSQSWPGPEYQSPARVSHVTQELYVYVDDVDKHFEQAREAGATIIDEPADQFYGDRRYRAVDPEGHHSAFATHVRDVPPEDMKPPA